MTSSAANGASGATTKNVAPYKVSGRVVKTRTGSSRPSTAKSTQAPSERPIQFRCIVKMRSGQAPSNSPMSSSSRWAYSVVRKYHWVSRRLVTNDPHRSHIPATTCSLASTVWSVGHQLT